MRVSFSIFIVYNIRSGKVRRYWLLGSSVELGTCRQRLREVGPPLGFSMEEEKTLPSPHFSSQIRGNLCSTGTFRESTVCFFLHLGKSRPLKKSKFNVIFFKPQTTPPPPPQPPPPFLSFHYILMPHSQLCCD